MSGLSLVGEQGPELVNFSNPGQVYSNGQSQNIFSEFANVVADKIASLEAKIVELQKSNTRDAELIANATIVASGHNAKIVSESIDNSVAVNNWEGSRNKVEML